MLDKEFVGHVSVLLKYNLDIMLSYYSYYRARVEDLDLLLTLIPQVINPVHKNNALSNHLDKPIARQRQVKT